MPEGAIVINKQNGIIVDFTVRLLWKDATGIAVLFDGTDFESKCKVMDDVSFDSSYEFEGGCIEGMTSATIVVYMGKGFNADECEACNVDELQDMGGDQSVLNVESRVHLQANLLVALQVNLPVEASTPAVLPLVVQQ
eukprot:jgi/Psemu1/43402/gm1.43402_g